MSDSDEACPHCGKHQWWQVFKALSRSGKTYYEFAQCNECLFVYRYEYPVFIGPFSKIKKKKRVKERKRE